MRKHNLGDYKQRLQKLIRINSAAKPHAEHREALEKAGKKIQDFSDKAEKVGNKLSTTITAPIVADYCCS